MAFSPRLPKTLTMPQAIESCIETLLSARAVGNSICPSEVARSLASDERVWRELMPDVRRVADAMAQRGLLVVTQRGKIVNALSAKGAIRLRKPM